MPQATVASQAELTAGDEGDSALSLTRLWRVLQRRRRPFMIVVAIVASLSFARTAAQEVLEPSYEGQFTLLISDPVNTPTNRGSQDGGGAIESLARNTTAVDVPTLIQVLQSSTVLEPVYNKLRQEGFKETPQLAVQLVQVNSGNSAGLANVVASGVLQVTARGKDEKAVSRMLELSEKATIDWSLDQKRLQLREGVRFLDQQAPELQKRNAALQEELSRFRRQHSTLNPQEEATALTTQMADLQAKLLQLDSTRQELQDIQREVAGGRLTARSFSLVSGGGGGGAAGAGGGAAAGGLAAGLPDQGLLDEWQRLEGAIGSARGSYRPDSPVLQGLVASQNRLRPALQKRQLEAVQAALRQNNDRRTATLAELGRMREVFQQQPQLLTNFEALQQKIAIAAGNLNDYLKTRDQFQLEIAQNTSPWQIITPSSVRRSSTGTGLGRGLIQSLLLGVIAGTAVAIGRDRLDHVFHAPEEVEKDLGVPLLGHIPYVQAFDGLRRDKRLLADVFEPDNADAVGRYQRFYYQEALRNFYTSLRFLDPGKEIRSVAISSTQPAEGKSLINILLAKTLSELGLSVLMVDADLRKPQLHQRLGLDNLRGLSNLLSDPTLAWQDVVQPVDWMENVHVITSGRMVPNPPRLLSSPAMGELVTSVANSGRYDMVIYDPPPLLGLADAPLLAEQLDGLVLLVSLNLVDRNLPRESLKRLRSSGASLLGVVTNAMRPKGEQAYAYAYSYGRARMDPSQVGTYGALDPSASYAYYEAGRGGDGSEQTDSTPAVAGQPRGQARSRLERMGKSLERKGASLLRWLDG